MTTEKTSQDATQILAQQASYLISVAARAPSVHNTQPWLFSVAADAIELHGDRDRRLGVDPAGREMLISCGAALFGLRLAVRSLGYLPVVDLLPEPGRPLLLARVRLGAELPLTPIERKLIEAVPHRHTHRGPFQPGPLPAGLLPALQHDAAAEHATLALVDTQLAYRKLADVMARSKRWQDAGRMAQADVRRWSRSAGSRARDGVPARAFAADSGPEAGRLPQRDFDMGRGIGLLTGAGAPPEVTAALLTRGDGPADWLRAGQALHRVLLHAASRWVFASLYTQPLEAPAIRRLIKTRLALPGAPQMLLQLGVARTTRATARRPANELIDP